jgi:hypothetical protein
MPLRSAAGIALAIIWPARYELSAIPISVLVSVNLVQAQVSRLMDTAALFQALGGGWWNR